MCLEGVEPADPLLEYNLHTGVNLISFPVPGSVLLGDAFPDDIEPVIVNVISQGVAATKLPSGIWVGSLSEFSGGYGYWIKTTAGVILVFDLSTLNE